MLLDRRRTVRPAALWAAALAVVVAACSAAASPSPSPSAPPSANPSPSSGAGAVVVTIRVIDETYRILMTDPVDIAVARDLLAGKEGPRIPNGKVVRGDDGGVNTGYSWHIDPADVDWADVTIEVCDGKPSHVEAGTITSDRFCPWSAEVVAVEPAP